MDAGSIRSAVLLLALWPLILALDFPSRPPTVARLIVSGGVDPIKRQPI